MDNLAKLILEQLDIKTIRSIQKMCVNYITYSVDFKQITNRYGIKLQTKEIAELQEYCNYLLIIKQAFIEEQQQEKTTEKKEAQKEANASNCENITSTMTEDTNVTSKKKEKKK